LTNQKSFAQSDLWSRKSESGKRISGGGDGTKRDVAAELLDDILN